MTADILQWAKSGGAKRALTGNDLYSTDPCPRCNGSGHKIDPDAVRTLQEQSELTQAQIAQKMRISPQFLCDLLNDRREWTAKLLADFLQAIGKQNSPEGE